MLGESAGRSTGHSTRASARRRFTAEERMANTPLHDDPQEWPEDVKPESLNRKAFRDIRVGLFAALVAYLLLLVILSDHVVFGNIATALLTFMVGTLAIHARRGRRR